MEVTTPNVTNQTGGMASGNPSSSAANKPTEPVEDLLTHKKLQELIKKVDPMLQLDEDVEEALLKYADDYMDKLIEGSAALAVHRKSNSIEVKDVQTYLERTENIWVPGFGTEELRQYKKPPLSEAHKQRMAIVKKALKK